jgi:hypothetical protein
VCCPHVVEVTEFRSCFYFYHHVKGGQVSLNLLGPLVELVSHRNSNNIKMPSIKPMDNKNYLLDIS